MTKYDPEVREGLPTCRHCGKSWSHHTMAGDCPPMARSVEGSPKYSDERLRGNLPKPDLGAFAFGNTGPEEGSKS